MKEKTKKTKQTRNSTLPLSNAWPQRAGRVGEPCSNACTTVTPRTHGNALSVAHAVRERVALCRGTSNSTYRYTVSVRRHCVSRRPPTTRQCPGACPRQPFSQCSGLKRRGVMRLTSVLESCGPTPCLSTYHLLLVLGGCWDGGGSGNTLALNLATEWRVLGYCLHHLNASCRTVILCPIKKAMKLMQKYVGRCT